MQKQKGFVLTRGMIVIVAILMVGLLIWVLTLNTNRPTPNTDNAQDQTQQQPQQLTPEQQTAKNDAQAKEDVVRVAAAITEYVNNNSGTYPSNQAQLDEIFSKYIVSKPFLSPITQNSYVLSLTATYEPGTMNLLRGTCNANKNGVVPTQNTRTYALLTALTDKSVYCVDI